MAAAEEGSEVDPGAEEKASAKAKAKARAIKAKSKPKCSPKKKSTQSQSKAKGNNKTDKKDDDKKTKGKGGKKKTDDIDTDADAGGRKKRKGKVEVPTIGVADKYTVWNSVPFSKSSFLVSLVCDCWDLISLDNSALKIPLTMTLTMTLWVYECDLTNQTTPYTVHFTLPINSALVWVCLCIHQLPRTTEMERQQLKKAAKNAGNIMAFVQQPLQKHKSPASKDEWAWF